MKYIKKFENSEHPQIGDYVLIKTRGYSIIDDIITKSKEYVDTHIGKIVDIKIYSDDEDDDSSVLVEYENVPTEIKSYFNNNRNKSTRKFSINRIVATGKTKEEVLMKVQQNKYNL